MFQPKKKREIFLLSRFNALDYLLFLGAIALLALLFYLVPKIDDILDSPRPAPFNTFPGPVAPRTIQITHPLSLLWQREEYAIPHVAGEGSLFFATGERTLVSPMADLSERVYYLEAFDIVTGQTQWQTRIPSPVIIRIYDNKFFALSGAWSGQSPAKDGQELPYCSFWERQHSLSAYHVNTGHEIWRYGYRGVNINNMYFVDQTVNLEGSHSGGTHQLLINVDINSGHIIHQRCNGPNSAPPRNSGGISSSTYFVKWQGADCNTHKPFCFATEGNRLHILTGSSKPVAYIDFEGAALEPADMDVAVHNNIIVVHLDDSDQLFAFRLP